jgi:hypothetical protein
MDGRQFDELSQALAGSRRAALRLMLGGVAGALLPLRTDDAAAGCVKLGKRCGGGAKCCGGARCKQRTCQCPTGKKACDGKCVPEATCCADADCPACQKCDDGACEAATGAVCGQQSGAGALRCCAGVCPAPTCRVVGTSCLPGESVPQCLAACCSNRVGCDGLGANCSCTETEPGDPCASDADCAYEVDGGPRATRCICGTCCVEPGVKIDSRYFSCADCCSGACRADGVTCS